MIAKLDIEKFGLFCNFQWEKCIGNENNTDFFKRVNIIYGRNYSGKTTLSRIFRSIETGQLHHRYIQGSFCLTDNEGNNISQNDLTYQNKVRVYNKDFVRDNLSWLIDESNGEIKPFTLLGTENINAMKRIKEIELELGDIEAKTGLLYQLEERKLLYRQNELKLKKKKDDLESQLADEANRKIKINKYFIQQGLNYNVTYVRREIEEIINSSMNFYLGIEEQEQFKKSIDEEAKSHIEEISHSSIKLADHISVVKTLIEKKISLSQTLTDIVTDGILQEWVDQGRKLHKGKRDKCAFCGKMISEERWQELDAHFSKESDGLKQEIQAKLGDLESAKSYLEKYLDTISISKDKYYYSFQAVFEDIYRQWNNFVSNYNRVILLLSDKLRARYNDIFTPKSFNENENKILDYACINDIIKSFTTIIDQINDLSRRNNDKSNTINIEKDKARKMLRYSEIQDFITTIDYSKKMKIIADDEEQIRQKKDELTGLEKIIYELETEKKQREFDLNDEGKAAKKINSHLSNFFGHDGLELKPLEENEQKIGFVKIRGNEIAHNLSEGECSLISFCYFITKMEDELNGTDRDKLIIYTDDPISSLDNNHIFFMYSLIETIIAKDKKYRQLFISTHNLDFLKYLKRLTIPDSSANYFLVEKLKQDNEYKCELVKMPDHLKNYVTEYHFLFNEIYQMAKELNQGDKARSIENQFSRFYNLPNNMRKFLECYLYYHYPDTENPLNNLQKLFDGHIPSLVNRIVNEYSHLSWGDRGTLVMDVKEAEDTARIILQTIKDKDIDHFNALCDSIKVDRNIAL